MDYDRLIAAAEHYTLPKAAAHYRRLAWPPNTAALATSAGSASRPNTASV